MEGNDLRVKESRRRGPWRGWAGSQSPPAQHPLDHLHGKCPCGLRELGHVCPSSWLAQENPSRAVLFFLVPVTPQFEDHPPLALISQSPGLLSVAPATLLVYFVLESPVPGADRWITGPASTQKEPHRDDCAISPALRGHLPPVKWGQQNPPACLAELLGAQGQQRGPLGRLPAPVPTLSQPWGTQGP